MSADSANQLKDKLKALREQKEVARRQFKATGWTTEQAELKNALFNRVLELSYEIDLLTNED